jgi:hypothetical protein
VPPVGWALAVPSFTPLPDTLVEVAFAASKIGCEIVAEIVAGHPAASVIWQEIEPGARPETVEVVAPFDHKKVAGLFAPVKIAVAEPFAAPKHEIFVAEIEAESAQPKLFTVTVCEAEQPFWSVVVTE